MPPSASQHANVLRQAKARGDRVVVALSVDPGSVEGSVEYVSPTGALARVGGIEVPLDYVIRVMPKQRKKALPR